MGAAMIAQLVIALGPPALQLVEDLVNVWNKPTLTPEEVLAITGKAKKSYAAYIAAAQTPAAPTA